LIAKTLKILKDEGFSIIMTLRQHYGDIAVLMRHCPKHCKGVARMNSSDLSGANRYCSQCGNQLSKGARFCSNCGAAVPVSPPPVQQYEPEVHSQKQQQYRQQVQMQSPADENVYRGTYEEQRYDQAYDQAPASFPENVQKTPFHRRTEQI
jgi:hypothetical protein